MYKKYCFKRVTILENLGHLDKTVFKSEMKEVVKKLDYSNWLFIYYLAQVSERTCSLSAEVAEAATRRPQKPDFQFEGAKMTARQSQIRYI